MKKDEQKKLTVNHLRELIDKIENDQVVVTMLVVSENSAPNGIRPGIPQTTIQYKYN